jgi:hypothetical protein
MDVTFCCDSVSLREKFNHRDRNEGPSWSVQSNCTTKHHPSFLSSDKFMEHQDEASAAVGLKGHHLRCFK